MSDASAGDILRSLFSGRSISAETHDRIETENELHEARTRTPGVYAVASFMMVGLALAIFGIIPAVIWLFNYATGGDFALLPIEVAWAVAVVGSIFSLAWLVLLAGIIWTRQSGAFLTMVVLLAMCAITTAGVLNIVGA